MTYKLYLFFLLIVFRNYSLAQDIEILTKGEPVSIRGMSVVDDQTIWVSGSQGKVARSIDGGITWQWHQVPGYEKREFRDIEAFDQNTAVILDIAEPGAILRTIDGGKTWQTVFTDSSAGIFMDAFHFNGNTGSLIGDPIGGAVYLLQTKDKGQNWMRVPSAPVAETGEACFASSGTNILTRKNGTFVFVTGGMAARLNWNNKFYPLPLVQGKESTGANSIDSWGDRAIVVGGDFANDTAVQGNAALVRFRAVPEITVPAKPPHGYRSSVAYIDANRAITCGTSGVDLSKDGGKTWTLISRDGYHVCQKSKAGKSVYLAGSGGRIARLRQ